MRLGFPVSDWPLMPELRRQRQVNFLGLSLFDTVPGQVDLYSKTLPQNNLKVTSSLFNLVFKILHWAIVWDLQRGPVPNQAFKGTKLWAFPWSCLSPGSTPKSPSLAAPSPRALKVPTSWYTSRFSFSSPGATQECFDQIKPGCISLV